MVMKTRKRMLKKAKKMGWKVVVLEEYDYTKQAAEQYNKLLEEYLALETNEEIETFEIEIGWK